jgi:plasmid stabilization system protein ParE
MIGLRALPEVSDDIAEAANWYRQESHDLGTELIEAVYGFLEEILATPLTRRPVYKDYRRGFMQRFPYAVYYRVGKDEIIIALVFHTARNPATMRRILRNREKLD